MAEPNLYEEQRMNQVEENKRKMEELRLHRLSVAVRVAAVREAAVKPGRGRPPNKPQKRWPAQTRRSSRVASLPNQPDYREIKTTKRRQSPPDVYATEEAISYALTKAEELKNQLCSDHPCFIKPIPYKCTTTNYVAIPLQSRKSNFPWCDEMVCLVDEEDVEFHLPYHALSGIIGIGWKMFAIGHKLADGDCLVFQQVQRTKFKIYIIRASSYYEKDHC